MFHRKNAPNSISAVAPPHTPPGELTALLQITLAGFKAPTSKGKGRVGRIRERQGRKGRESEGRGRKVRGRKERGENHTASGTQPVRHP